MNQKLTDQEQIRLSKLEELRQKKLDPYQVEKVNRTCSISEFISKYANKDNFDDEVFTLAGRVMALRQTFGVIKDFSGQVQFYLNKKKIDESLFDLFKKYLDLGDLVEIQGKAFVTLKNELTLDVTSFRIISKALKPLPEKWHGLVDEELKVRKRYVDLIVNDDTKDTFLKRSVIIKLVRNYLDNLDYLEVETPILQSIAGGAAALPFITFHNALKKNFYLRVAPELPLKKIIVGGFEKIYELGRVFRNEGMDSTHNPEFTSLEVYAAYENMEYMMDLTEKLFAHIAKTLNKVQCEYLDVIIDFSKPFKRIHMVDFVKEQTGINFFEITDLNEALALAKKHNIHVENHQRTVGHIINLFFEAYCEEKCVQPTFVFGHPIDISPLSKKDYSDERFTKRFELFINKKEYANAFAELNDPIDQLERFQKQAEEKKLGNDEANSIDEDFVEALNYGLVPTAGLGIGIDRLVMLFTNKRSIREVLFFPHLK